MADPQNTIVPDRELYRLILEAEHPFVTTTDIAEQTEISREAVYGRLMDLVDEGELSTRKTGAKGRVFWTDERAE